MGKPVPVTLTDEERAELERRARKMSISRAKSERARVVLLAAEGLSNPRIAAKLGVHYFTARKWRNRFAERGMAGLEDKPRPGRPPRSVDEDAGRIE